MENTKICECGESFVPGKTAVWKSHCPKCAKAKIAEGHKNRKKKAKPQNPLPELFSGHNNLYDWLKDRAEKEFRTPENQILHMVSEAMGNDGRAD